MRVAFSPQKNQGEELFTQIFLLCKKGSGIISFAQLIIDVSAKKVNGIPVENGNLFPEIVEGNLKHVMTCEYCQLMSKAQRLDLFQ